MELVRRRRALAAWRATAADAGLKHASSEWDASSFFCLRVSASSKSAAGHSSSSPGVSESESALAAWQVLKRHTASLVRLEGAFEGRAL